MEDVLENIVPQAGILNHDENPARVQAPRWLWIQASRIWRKGAYARCGQSGWCRKGDLLGSYCISKDERLRRRRQPVKRGKSEIISVEAVGPNMKERYVGATIPGCPETEDDFHRRCSE